MAAEARMTRYSGTQQARLRGRGPALARLAQVDEMLRTVHRQMGAADAAFQAAVERAAGSEDESAKDALAQAHARLMTIREENVQLQVERNELMGAVKAAEEAASARKRAVHEAVRDTAGFDLRPDPLRAATPAELVTALDTFRIWAGEPPYREMAQRAGSRVAASTICTALKNHSELPALKVVLAVIAGCGGSEDDQSRFATAWRRIRLGCATGGQVRERPDLRVVPAAGTG